MRDRTVELRSAFPFDARAMRHVALVAEDDLNGKLPELADRMPVDTRRLRDSWRVEARQGAGGRVYLRFGFEWYGVFNEQAERAFEEWLEKHLEPALGRGLQSVGLDAGVAALHEMLRELDRNVTSSGLRFTPGRKRPGFRRVWGGLGRVRRAPSR